MKYERDEEGATHGDVSQTELGCRNRLKKEERVETGKKDAALLWKVSHSLNVCFMVRFQRNKDNAFVSG